ncbi:unnamed protein product, partial [Callosobruchus maculatus]
DHRLAVGWLLQHQPSSAFRAASSTAAAAAVSSLWLALWLCRRPSRASPVVAGFGFGVVCSSALVYHRPSGRHDRAGKTLLLADRSASSSVCVSE